MASNSIIVKKYSDVIEEFIAAEIITPGMILEFDSTGKVIKHNVAGGNIYPMIALEDELQGRGITDDYASASPVQVWLPGMGDIARLILDTSQTVAIGDWLKSNGNGKVVKWSIAASGGIVEYPEVLIGRAAEAVTTTGTAALIKTRIIG